MAIVDGDEAASGPVGMWVQRRLAEGTDGPALLCLRTDDIEATAHRTGRPSLRMTRTRPDGVELAWHLAGLDAAFADGLPFFIQWHVDDADHPGRAVVEHRRPVLGIDWVELGGDPARLASWLGPHDLPLRLVDGAPGPHRMAIAVATGEPIIIG